MLSDFGNFNKRSEKFVGRDCDVINKVAYKPFPNWKVSWPRTDFAISLSKFAERKPTKEVSRCKFNYFQQVLQKQGSQVVIEVKKVLDMEKREEMIKSFERDFSGKIHLLV